MGPARVKSAAAVANQRDVGAVLYLSIDTVKGNASNYNSTCPSTTRV